MANVPADGWDEEKRGVNTTETGRLIWNGLLDLVYPPCCLACGARMEEGALCEDCIREFTPVPPPCCESCGLKLDTGESRCLECADGRGYPIAWSQTLGQFSGTLRHAILRFKYEGKAALAQPLGMLLARSLDHPPSPLLTSPSGEALTFNAVVPVPLHPSKLRQRGFNQAERLARIVAKERNWPLDANSLVRIRRTRAQANLSGAERADNVRGAFACRQSQRYASQSVLIVDDVLTTMNTCREAARVIKDAGAGRVCVVALARG